MRHTVCLLIVPALVVWFTGCNTLRRQPKLIEAKVTPSVLRPQDTGIITVKAVDPRDVVDRIVGVIEQDPRLEFKPRDDGEGPDEKAGDGIWSLQVDVPFNAPAGQYDLKFTAYNSKGEVIRVRTGRRSEGPLTQSCTVTIEYPPQ